MPHRLCVRWPGAGCIYQTVISNVHPHMSCDGRFSVVHNDIVENYMALREKRSATANIFSSQRKQLRY